MPAIEPYEQITVSLPAERAAAIRDMANRRYRGDVSVAVAAATEQWESDLAWRARALAAVAEIEAELGPPTEEELAAAHAEIAELMGWSLDDPRLTWRNNA